MALPCRWMTPRSGGIIATPFYVTLFSDAVAETQAVLCPIQGSVRGAPLAAFTAFAAFPPFGAFAPLTLVSPI